MYPEAIIYVHVVKDNPLFLSPQRPVAPVTQSPINNGETNEDREDSGDPEDATFRSRMTSQGLFKSRNKQREEEHKRKKRQAESKQEEIIDLTKEKQIKVAERHANAAKAHADGVQWQTKISALKEARELGVSAESLRPYMMQT